jgi:hypothetical protein
MRMDLFVREAGAFGGLLTGSPEDFVSGMSGLRFVAIR